MFQLLNLIEMPAPLWADLDIEAIIKIAFFVVFIFGSAFVKLVSSILNKGPASLPTPPAPPKSAKVGIPDPVRREVDDFLRRLGMDLPANQQTVVAEDDDEAEIVEAQEVRRPVDTISSWRQTPAGGTQSRESYDQPFPAGQRVEQHVQSHIDTSKIRQHTASLGENIGRADERVEGHLRDKFQHAVGSLVGSTTRSISPVAEGTDSAVWDQAGNPTNVNADRIREMIRSRQSFRDALILSEILRPPASD